MVRWADYFSVFLLLVFVLTVAVLLEIKTTGKNIAPNYNKQNDVCNESYVYGFWKKYFKDDFKDLKIVWEIKDNCNEGFVSYKVLGTKIYYLSKEKDYGYGFVKIGGKQKRFDSRIFYKIGVYDFNNTDYLKRIEGEKDFNRLLSLLANVNDVDLKDLGVEGVSSANKIFSDYFKNYINNEFYGFFPGYYVANNSVEGFVGDYYYKTKGLKFISKTKTDLGFGYLKYLYGPVKRINLAKRIPNLKFKTSKYWKYGFSLKDYFDREGVCDFGLEDGSGGIVAKIVGGNVLFKSNNFSGYKRFDINCSYDNEFVLSNKFWVGFYDRLNRAPVQIYLIENFNLSKGEKMKIPLNDFFKDPENDSLNFVVFGSDFLNFVMEGDDLYVSFKEGFKSSWFQVNVSDGELSILSNKVVVGYSEKKGLDNLLINSNKTNNKTKVDKEAPEQKDLKKYKIFIIIGIVIVVLEAILLIIYFGIIKKRFKGREKRESQKTIKDYAKKGLQ